MIYVNIRGRLGNQLFIYAFARALQKSTNQQITLNYTSFRKHYNNTAMDLEQFNIPEDIMFENSKELPWFANTDGKVIRILRHYFPKLIRSILQKMNVLMWLGDEYVEVKVNKRRDIYIDGFWQSSRYFKSVYKELKNELIPKMEMSKEIKTMGDLINQKESVCVSVRRGDYVTVKKNRDVYYICDEKYLNTSIMRMVELVPNVTWFIFSDDADWVKDNIVFPGEVFYQPPRVTPLETLYLMKACKHFIISNSSFSWWGQYLSNNDNKIVIGPAKWYVDGRKTDIIEEEWIKIEV
ncbi:alpha-1,2-fucosyltransferase [Hungatella hathewayi]|uniref:alpha-1,2-fucosyltransferase n=1 Tax=Hungatella hathewayi TaxID=154046 RepID=UPI00033CAF56|nr:alpha-1,2-fucosyltransferase [Hungatella hathewayi]CCZ58625.1 epsH [Hungatella hathewayi CAG:224]